MFLCSHYRLTRCHNFQFEKHVCEILSRPFHYSSFSRVVSAHNEELFSNKAILCCRGRWKTDAYNRSRAVFIQEPRKFLPIDGNGHHTDSKASLNCWLLSLSSGQKLTWMNYRNCCFVLKMMPYNKLLTNFTCSGPYWGILALGRFCTDLAALSPYSKTSGQYPPVRPSRSVR